MVDFCLRGFCFLDPENVGEKLFFFNGDNTIQTIPSDMGIRISHHMNPYQATRIPWNVTFEGFERCSFFFRWV